MISGLSDPQFWPQVLPRLQAVINLTIATSTGHSPHQIMYSLTLGSALALPASTTMQDFTVWIDAQEALTWAAMSMKWCYDVVHSPQYFCPGDLVLIWLHHRYSIHMPVSKKYGPQFAGPVKVLQQIGQLAYHLEILEHWKTYDVFLVAQLEPCP